MLFRDYIELLYQAYLQDKGYLQTLRDKIKSEEFNKDQMYDPAFVDAWKSIDPTNPETHHSNRIKFHRNNIYDPQQGIYTYEHHQDAREKLRVIRECLSRRRERDKHQKSKG
jgi:hypothetical protein